MPKSANSIAAFTAALICTVSNIACAQANVADPSAASTDDQPVKSQNVASSELGGEIVVTAQKRSQRLQDVGLSITAYSGAQLRTLNVVDSRDLAAFTPGVHVGGALAGQSLQYTIRGVTQNDFNDIVEAPNAVYLDEGYIAVGQGQTFALFDIERVEVLKGPQGTLFGRNATGGLVHYVTVKPELDEFKGFVDARYGMYDSTGQPSVFRGEAAVNIPLSPKVASRGAILWNRAGSYLRNRYPAGYGAAVLGASPGPGAGANMGAADTLAGRLTTLLEPSDGASITLSLNGARTRTSTAPYQQTPTISVFDATGELINTIAMAPDETRASIGPNGTDFGSDLNNDGIYGDSFGRPVPGADFFGYKDPDGAGVITSSDFAFKNHGRAKAYGANLTGEFDLSDSVTLTSVSDYKHFYKLLFADTDAGPYNFFNNFVGGKADTVSQEFRFNGRSDNATWAAGLYYLKINAKSIAGLKIMEGGLGGPALDLGANAHLKTDSYSAFGQVDWKFAPNLTLVLGARIIQEQKDYEYAQAIYAASGPQEAEVGAPVIIGPVFGPNGPEAFTDKRGETLWAAKAQLEYRPDNNLMLYLGLNRGVKAGSYNAALAGGLPIPVSAIPYKPEVLISYEGGLKYTLPDGVSRINASAFYYDYSDYQAFLFNGVSGIVINADDTTYGFEADMFTSPFPGLDVGLSASYFKATVKDVPLRAGGPIVRDVKPAFAPQLQGSAIVRYSWDALGGRMSIGGDAAYSSSYYYNLRNFDADKFSSYVVVNMSATLTVKPFEITAAVRNLTNAKIGIIGFNLASATGANDVSYRAPRLFELGLRYSF